MDLWIRCGASINSVYSRADGRYFAAPTHTSLRILIDLILRYKVADNVGSHSAALPIQQFYMLVPFLNPLSFAICRKPQSHTLETKVNSAKVQVAQPP